MFEITLVPYILTELTSFLIKESRLQELIIVRGLPGSGKTKVAKGIVKSLGGKAVHFESVMYFRTTDDNHYRSNHVKSSHDWCLRSTENALKEGRTVVVANTFTRGWEIEPFLSLGKELGLKTTVIKAIETNPNKFGIPDGTIRHMSNRWEDVPNEITLTPEVLKIILR